MGRLMVRAGYVPARLILGVHYAVHPVAIGARPVGSPGDLPHHPIPLKSSHRFRRNAE